MTENKSRAANTDGGLVIRKKTKLISWNLVHIIKARRTVDEQYKQQLFVFYISTLKSISFQ